MCGIFMDENLGMMRFQTTNTQTMFFKFFFISLLVSLAIFLVYDIYRFGFTLNSQYIMFLPFVFLFLAKKKLVRTLDRNTSFYSDNFYENGITTLVLIRGYFGFKFLSKVIYYQNIEYFRLSPTGLILRLNYDLYEESINQIGKNYYSITVIGSKKQRLVQFLKSKDVIEK